MLFYLTLWFPQAYRARAVAGFVMAAPLSFVIAGPLSSVILEMDGVLTLHGWQWMFLLEGLPACMLAFAVLRFLPDGPTHALWLSGDEKQTIVSRLAAEDCAPRRGFWPTLRDPLVLAFGLVYFINLAGGYGVRLWLPQIVQEMGFSNLANGFVVGLLNAAAIVAMILWSRSSDVTGERIWHVALGVLVAAFGLALACFVESDLLMLVALGLATVSILLIHGPFWSLTSSVLGGQGAAGGIALITSISSLGGFLGPWMIGILRQETGSYTAGMAMLAVALVFEAMIVLALGRAMAPQAAMARAKVGG
jgi:ACS family tartrate transporter-like MFS transporter